MWNRPRHSERTNQREPSDLRPTSPSMWAVRREWAPRAEFIAARASGSRRCKSAVASRTGTQSFSPRPLRGQQSSRAGSEIRFQPLPFTARKRLTTSPTGTSSSGSKSRTSNRNRAQLPSWSRSQRPSPCTRRIGPQRFGARRRATSRFALQMRTLSPSSRWTGTVSSFPPTRIRTPSSVPLSLSGPYVSPRLCSAAN